MRNLSRVARLYIVAVCLAGLSLTAGSLWAERSTFGHHVAPGVTLVTLTIILTVFAAVLALAPVEVSYGSSLTVNLAPLFAGVLTLPPGLAAIAAALGTIHRLPSPSYPWYRFAFNRGMFALIYGGAGLLYTALSHNPGAGTTQVGADFNVVAGALLAVLFVATINPALVSTAIHLETGDPLRKVADQILRGAYLSYVGLAPLGALIAFLVSVGRVEGIAIAASILVLLLVYRELAKRSISIESIARGAYLSQARLIDQKDHSTHGHSQRVGELSEAVALKMRLTGDLVEQIRIGATLHDIGKIAIPDHILHKKGPLDAAEWEIMKSHAQEGRDVLAEQPILERASDVVWSHHENFDGTGYPRGLRGRAIPVGGRITRVVDSFDCMVSVREYRVGKKEPFDALADISSHSGTWYDPEVVDTFTDVLLERNPSLATQMVSQGERAPASILDALRFTPFLKLWSAAGLSNFGDMLTTTGLALAAYGSGHSTIALGLVVAVRALPNLLLGLLAGQMVDRYDRKTVMILMDIIRMGLVGVLPLLSHAPLGVILGVAFCVSTATVLFNPARAAALPDLVPYTLLSGANSALAVAERGTEIAGFSAAAAIIAFGGVPLVFTIDAITFALSAIIVLTITFPAMVGSSRPETGRSNRREILDGLKQIFGSSELRSIFSFSFLMVAAGSALAPLTVPLAIEHLHAGNSGYAICLAAIAVGATVGALLTGMLHTPRRGMLMVGGAMGMGGATIMAGLSPVLPLTVAFLAVGGVANMVYLIPMLTSIQELTETHIRGRVMAARFTMVQIGLLVGALYATVTTSSLLPQASAGVAVVGSGLLMVAVASWAGAFGSIRRL